MSQCFNSCPDSCLSVSFLYCWRSRKFGDVNWNRKFGDMNYYERKTSRLKFFAWENKDLMWNLGKLGKA